MIALKGCVQPTMVPTIDAAMTRVLDRLGIGVITPSAGGCCGAIRHHLADGQGGLTGRPTQHRCLVASDRRESCGGYCGQRLGCGVMVKDYGHLLADDPAYADKARRVSDLAKDPIELIEPMLSQLQRRNWPRRSATVSLTRPPVANGWPITPHARSSTA